MIKSKITAFFAALILCASFLGAANVYAIDGTVFSKLYRILEGVWTSGPVVVEEPAPVCSTCTNGIFSTTVIADPDINKGNNRNAVFNWQFESNGQDVRTGTYANGDIWVAPAVGETSVTFNVLTGSHDVAASTNPQIESYGIGSGVRNYGNYDETKDIIPDLPQTYTTDISILAAVMRDEVNQSVCGTSGIVGECVDAYQVITVLMAPPTNNGVDQIRPPITTTAATKTHHSISDFVFTRLPSRSEFTGTDAAGFEKIRKKWSHSTEIFAAWDSEGDYPCEGSRCFRSHILVPNYAAQTAASFYNDWAVLMSDDTDNADPDKIKAIAAMITYGQDVYHNHHTTAETRYYGSGAGQHLGQLPAAAFYVNLLDPLGSFAGYRTVIQGLQSLVDAIPDAGPHEIDQINPGPNGPTWGDDGTTKAYWADLKNAQCHANAVGSCNTNEGSKAERDPTGQIDGPAPRPGGGYQQITTGSLYSLTAVMCITPGMGDLINYDGIVEYVDRFEASNIQTGPDTCAAPSPADSANVTCDPFKIQLDSPGTAALYQSVTGCNDIATLWGPDPDNPSNSCISVSPSNPNSRFQGVTASVLVPQNTAAQLFSNWSTLRGTSANCRI